jgi:CTP synthase (UTP-ammonia lyase)
MDDMTPRIALVGDRSPSVRSHTRVPLILEALRERDGLTLDAYWISTEESTGLEGFDGIWILPGSPYRSEDGAVNAARTAREQGIPLLGTCGGFQHALLEYARNVCGLSTAAHAENDPDAADPLIRPLSCSLAGHEAAVRLAPGSLAGRIMGVDVTVERYFCSFGPDPARLGALEAHGLRFTGRDESGDVRVAELPDHPFYLVTLFQPELAEQPPHPLIRAFAAATAGHASLGQAVAAGHATLGQAATAGHEATLGQAIARQPATPGQAAATQHA